MIAPALRQAREFAGLTIEALSAKTGLTPLHIRCIEDGAEWPDALIVRQWMSATNCELTIKRAKK